MQTSEVQGDPLTQIQTLGSGDGGYTPSGNKTILCVRISNHSGFQGLESLLISLYSPMIIVLRFSRQLPATSWKPWGQKVSSFCTEKAQSRLLSGYPACSVGKRQRPHCSWGQPTPPPTQRTLITHTRGDQVPISQEWSLQRKQGSEAER